MPVFIECDRIPPGGRTITGEEPASILELENDPFLRVVGAVSCNLKAEIVSNQLIVNGSVDAPISFRCSRCGRFFETAVADKAFRVERKLTSKNECVDLTADIRESIILAFPSYPVCSQSCKGLCTRCGMNLNEGTCNCKSTTDERWMDLNRLNLK